MIQWLSVNIGSIVVILVLALVVFAIVRHMVKQKRIGKGGCGCGCEGCANSPYCHPKK